MKWPFGFKGLAESSAPAGEPRRHPPDKLAMAVEMVLHGAPDMEDEEQQHGIAEQLVGLLGEIVDTLAGPHRQSADVEQPEEARRADLHAGGDYQPSAQRNRQQQQVEQAVDEAGEPRLPPLQHR